MSKKIKRIIKKVMPNISEKDVENMYGWPERGATILGVKRGGKGKLVVFTEDYDVE